MEELKSAVLATVNLPESQIIRRNELANQSAWCIRNIEAWFHLKQLKFGEENFESQLQETRNKEAEVVNLVKNPKGLPKIAEIKMIYQHLIEDSSTAYLGDGLNNKIKLSSTNNTLKWVVIFGIGLGTLLLTIGKIIEYSIRSHVSVVESNQAVISEMNRLRRQLLRDNKKEK